MEMVAPQDWFRARFGWARRMFVPAFLICLNLFVFGPYAVYAGNSAEFLVSYAQVLPVLLLPCMVVLVLLLLPALLLRPERCEIYHAALLFLAVVTYIHGNLLRWETGVLDGNALDVSSLWRTAVDVAVWIVLAWLGWNYRRWLWLQGWKICAVLALFQLIGLTALSGVSPSQPQSSSLPPERLSWLSAEANVIHIILDGFQGSVFEELLRADPNLEQELDGFTFFRDAITSSDVTYLSVPASLTGKPYSNDRPISEYLAQSFNGPNLYGFLAGKGYEIDVASPVWWNANKSDFTSFFRIPTPYKADLVKSTALLLLDLSLFRQAPHFLKSSLYRNGEWLLSSMVLDEPEQQFAHFAHTQFLRDVLSHMSVRSATPVYKFIHLLTPHAPLVSNADCTFAGGELEYNGEHFSRQSRCTVQVVVELLNRLKDLGIYDRSVILIYGDHGGGAPFEMRDAQGRRTTSSESLRRVWGNPLPLVLIKPRSSRGKLKTAQQPVALTDIPATVADLLESKRHPFPGQSMFSVAVDQPRVRTFYRSTMHRNDAAAKDHFDNYSRFEVTGSIYDLSAWSEEELHQDSIVDRDRTYRWGAELSFGGKGTCKPFLDGGWSPAPSGDITWTEGNEAGLSVPLPATEAVVRMQVSLKPLVVPGRLEQQRVTVIVNDRELGRWILTENQFQSMELQIPPEVLSSGSETKLRFLLPDAAMPSSLGASRDSRKLALAFMNLRFDELSATEAGHP